MSSAARELALHAAVAKRMFRAPVLYRWVCRNLRTLPSEGGVRHHYLSMARGVRGVGRRWEFQG